MEKKNENELLTLTDIILVVARNWKWYTISLVICLGIAFIYVKKSPVIYERHALVLIKSRGAYSQMQNETALFRDLGISASGGYLVDNELLVFKSIRLMEEVVRRHNLDVDYTQRGHFRDWSCYSSTPVKLKFPDSGETQEFSLKMTPMEGQVIQLSKFKIGKKSYNNIIKAAVGDTVNTPVGRTIILANTDSNPYSMVGESINVRKANLHKVAAKYNSRLVASLASKTSTIIRLSFCDPSTKRAEDVLNTLVQVYDEDAIQDKNRVAVNTEKFINEQLEILESELDDVDMAIANYKSTNRLTDIYSDASAYRSTVNAIEQRSADLQNQKAVAEYILDYIQKRESSDE